MGATRQGGAVQRMEIRSFPSERVRIQVRTADSVKRDPGFGVNARTGMRTPVAVAQETPRHQQMPSRCPSHARPLGSDLSAVCGRITSGS